MINRSELAVAHHHGTTKPPPLQDDVAAIACAQVAQNRAIGLLIEEVTRLREISEELQERIRGLK